MTLEDLYRLLRAGHVQAQGIVDTIGVPVVVLDEALCVVNTNPAFLETFRVNRDDIIGQNFLQLGNGQWNSPELAELLRRVIPRSTAVVDYEVVHDFPHIGTRTMLVSARRLVHPDNNSTLVLVAIDDVTDQRSRQTRQDILASEIRHRFKNFLSLVSSLARQSPADGVTAAEYRDTLLGRIDALAEAELSVFDEDKGDLPALLGRLTTPYEGRVSLEACPPLQLAPRQAASLSMILHELATNATKYGALSVKGGRVLIRAHVSGGESPELHLEWHEHDGPRMDAPAHPGFGSRLIQMIASQQLGGHADLRFEPKGLAAEVVFPLAAG